MPPLRRRAFTAVTLAALVALIAVTVIAGSRGGGAGGGSGRAFGAALSDPVPYDGRSPREPAGSEQRVLVELPRPSLGELPARRRAGPARQRAYVASLEREGRALRSALGARGVPLKDVVVYARVWNGFAATVRTDHLAGLFSLGVRAQPVRRFYPALGEPVRTAGAPPAPEDGAAGGGAASVAVLASGVDDRAGPLDGRTRQGYDAVDGDRDARPGDDPRDVRRQETSGTALAAIVAAAGERVLPIRVASLRAAGGVAAAEELSTSDALLAGLERAVDPDGDGAADDAVAVALVGVNAPYAGFGDAPEAQAARAAAGLGTLVVSPAGNEGPGRPAAGTVGSPAAAPAGVAVGALDAGARLPRVPLRAGPVRVAGAAVLAGNPAAGSAKSAAPLDAEDAAARLRRGTLRYQGRVAIVRAGADPASQAAAASAAGARLVVLAEPRAERPLPALPAGRATAPVLGVTGAAASALLKLGAGADVSLGRTRPQRAQAATAGTPLSPFSSRGPTLTGGAKPDLAAPGAAVTAVPGGGAAVVGGTAVAAAQVAAAAARIARGAPRSTPAQLKAELARMGGLATGARAGAATPPRGQPPAAPLGELRLVREGGSAGVRFAVGAFERGDPFGGGTLIRAAASLELALVTPSGRVVRTLTPPGGARDLLPAEYAYTLPASALRALPAGRYAFRATMRTPLRRGAVRRTSATFAR